MFKERGADTGKRKRMCTFFPSQEQVQEVATQAGEASDLALLTKETE